jgi:DNA repair exonuclease SbcCD ATPase subunit
LNETTAIDVTQQPEEEVVGNLVVQRDALLTVRLAAGKQRMQDYLERAKTISPVTEADLAECGILVGEIKSECEPLIDSLAPFKQQLNEKLDMIRSIEKCFTVSVAKPQQQAATTDPRFIAFQAVNLIRQKMNAALDAIERKKEEEARRVAELARKEQETRLKKINDGLDKLLSKAGDLAAQRAELELLLEDPDTTVEAAEIIRARIEKIDVQLGNLQAKTSEKQMEQAQVAAPVTVVPEATRVAGVSSKIVWVPSVQNQRALLQAVLNGSVPMSTIKWDMVAIKQYGNMMVKGQKNTPPTVPGVVWTAERSTSIK